MKKIYFSTILLFLTFNASTVHRRPLVPGPLFTFGQNVVGAGSLFGNVGTEYFKARDGSLWLGGLKILYGIRKDLSIQIRIPVVLEERRGPIKSKGWGSVALQGEYAFYTKNDTDFQYQTTLVGAVFFPTATVKILLSVANKKTDFFIGNTHTLYGHHWYAYTAWGGLIPVSKFDQVGSRFRYDMGAGYVLSNWPHYLALLIEMSGSYAPRNEHGQNGVRRAANIIFLGPSLRWVSSFLLQAGFQFPISQTGFERGDHQQIHLACSFAWKF